MFGSPKASCQEYKLLHGDFFANLFQQELVQGSTQSILVSIVAGVA
jgi:hypothetical protein